jgi:4-hydroxybenzoate polyprenyltransferase
MMRHVWKTMRPHQWIKNLFVFAALFFSGGVTETGKLTIVFLIFLSFCAMASAIYFLNDIMDRDRDRGHPTKCKRPIASGVLPLRTAMVSSLILAISSLALAYLIFPVVGLFLFMYGVLNVMYSFWLKHIVILDLFCVALGFVLRVLGGGFAIHVEPSSWLLIASFLLALFLALAKRRHELLVAEELSKSPRPVLEYYTPQLIDELISVVTPTILITYLLYTLDPETSVRFHSRILYVTGIFVIFGIFRYLYLVHHENLGGSPTDIVLTDLPLMSAILGWILTFSFIIYLT